VCECALNPLLPVRGQKDNDAGILWRQVEGLALIAGLFSSSHGPVSARVMKLALKLNECCQLAVGRMQDSRPSANNSVLAEQPTAGIALITYYAIMIL